jgi:hypothetical protein
VRASVEHNGDRILLYLKLGTPTTKLTAALLRSSASLISVARKVTTAFLSSSNSTKYSGNQLIPFCKYIISMFLLPALANVSINLFFPVLSAKVDSGFSVKCIDLI